MNDVDSIKTIGNPVGREMLLSRLIPIGVENLLLNEGLTDDQIADLVIDKDTTYSDIMAQIADLNDYVDEGIKIDLDNNPPVDVPPITDPIEPTA